MIFLSRRIDDGNRKWERFSAQDRRRRSAAGVPDGRGPADDPAEGQCWIVGATPTGGWVGQENAIALWTAGGWRFASARDGMQVTRLADGAQLRFDGAGWAAPGVVGTPVGGSTIDSEARSAITTLILHLAAQGLLISG